MEELFLFYVAGWRLLNIYFSLPLRAPYKLSGFGMWWKKDLKEVCCMERQYLSKGGRLNFICIT